MAFVEQFSVPSLANKIQDEAEAYAFLEELRWGKDGLPLCPHCGNLGAYFIKPRDGKTRSTTRGTVTMRRLWTCKKCRKQFSVLTGTIFHGTHISLRTWLFVLFEMSANKNGISAREIERKYALTPKSAWFLTQRIREAMRRDPLVEMLRGVVVADETYIGGAEKNKHAWKRDPSASGRGGKKVAVLSLIEKHSGEVRSRVVPDVTGITLRKAIEEQVDPYDSILQTDKFAAYNSVGPTFVAHETIDHGAGEYVRGDVTTNHAEGYFSQLKRSLDGTHHHVSSEHLDRYLAEFDFRYTTRKLNDTARMRMIVDQAAGRRLSYKPLTGH